MPFVSRAYASIAAAITLGLAVPAGAASGPDEPPGVGKRNDGGHVILDHFMFNPAAPGEIVPCVKILKKYLKRAEKDPGLQLLVSVTYYSNGQVKEKLVAIPLADMHLTEHHAQPDDKKYALIEGVIDVSDAPVDEGSTIEGDVELVGAPGS